MKRSVIIFNLLLSFTTTVVARRSLANPLLSPTQQRLHSVRGGGILPFSPKDAAKVVASVAGAQGALGVLAPTTSNALLGLPSNPLDNVLMKRTCAVFFSLALLIRELVFQGSGLTKAVGISTIPLAIEVLQPLLTGELVALGYTTTQQYLLLAFWALGIYNTLTGSQYADFFVKGIAVSLFGIGLPLIVSPEASHKLWGNPVKISTSTKAQTKALGSFATAAGIIISSLVWGSKSIDALKAIGYGWIPVALFFADGLFISKEFVELRMNQGLLRAYLIINFIAVATLAF